MNRGHRHYINRKATSSQPKRRHRKPRRGAGCVPVITCGGRKFIPIVLGQKCWGPGIKGKQFYSIPKGGVEPGENFYQTAVREVREETGFDISCRHLKFLFNGGRCVYYTLRLKMKGLPRLFPSDTTEIAKAFWLPLDDVATFLEEVEQTPMSFCNKDLQTFFKHHLHNI